MSIQPAVQGTLAFFPDLPIVLQTSAAPLTSDAGLLPLREFDEYIGLTAAFARLVTEEGKSLVVIAGPGLGRLAEVPELNALLPVDVPAAAGATALAQMDRSAVRPGPVAISAGDRALFFVTTRGTPADEDEWWSCHLDCEPEVDTHVAGLRWHCRDSYVLAPPSRDGKALTAHWLRPPDERPLPDGLRLLGFLADACEELAS